MIDDIDPLTCNIFKYSRWKTFHMQYFQVLFGKKRFATYLNLSRSTQYSVLIKIRPEQLYFRVGIYERAVGVGGFTHVAEFIHSAASVNWLTVEK